MNKQYARSNVIVSTILALGVFQMFYLELMNIPLRTLIDINLTSIDWSLALEIGKLAMVLFLIALVIATYVTALVEYINVHTNHLFQ